jgi:Amt family ammonium transporter
MGVQNFSDINSGDTAWMLTATGLVLLMTPGLALFYGGMAQSRNIISTMLQSYIAMGIVSILWVVIGFSIAFGEKIGLDISQHDESYGFVYKDKQPF